MIDITLLGTAALVPIPERALTAAFLTCGGHSILFDCGEGTQSAAVKAGVSLMKTDLIALTHYHGDHILGLPGLLKTMWRMGRKEPLYITGPEGLWQKAMEPILRLTGRTAYPIELIELPAEGLQLRKLIRGWASAAKLTVFKTVHKVPSQGYCFTLGRAGKFLPQKAKALGVPVNQWSLLQNGQSVQFDDTVILPEQVLGEPRKGLKFVFTGDTEVCDSMIDAAQGADLMICDATYGDDTQVQHSTDYSHMTFAQAATVAAKANVKRLWLAHFSQRIRNPKDYLPNATAIFANTICGQDGMSMTLHFED
ncbi:MAG: ribonuclease Z [Quinella sp. 1Q5]|nr:ribonuclease Z [Quinella sp. 1Q5]